MKDTSSSQKWYNPTLPTELSFTDVLFRAPIKLDHIAPTCPITMAGNSPHDYKSLLLQAEEKLKQAEEKIKQAEEREKQAGERQRQAEERQRLAEERREQEEERSRPTTFAELIHHSHKLLSKQIRVAIPSKSTTGSIPLPKGKHCPTKLRPWTDCNSQQQFIYDRVCKYLQPTGHESVRLFPSLIALEEFARRFALRPISSEQGLETYERIAVEDHVRDVISELCKIPAARDMNLCLVMVSGSIIIPTP